MVTLDQFKQKINKRPVIIMLHGASIKNMENYICELKDLDVCYCSLNFFPIIEDFILSKINKQLDFVYDTSHIDSRYVQKFHAKARIPRLSKYLDNKNNIFITTKTVLHNIMFITGFDYFGIKYHQQILLVDNLQIYTSFPNSALTLLGLSIIGEASKIILCGFDGYNHSIPNIDTYYKPALQIIDKSLAGTSHCPHLNDETNSIEKETLDNLDIFCQCYKIKQPPIFNCSEKSNYTIFPKIKYSELVNIIKEK